MTNEDKDLSEGDLNVVVGVNDVGKAFKSRSVKDLGPGSSLHSIKKIHKHPKTNVPDCENSNNYSKNFRKSPEIFRE